ncbi:MAG TPA: Rne/Rng family ribonuclease [Aliidongia sp.]|nr:Rne/Rng family ribonuclease [Aliidongia sp.]
MARRMLIDATHPEETRVVVLNGNRLDEFDFETSTKKQIKGNIYLAKITRVEPSLQAAFVEYGGNRHGFLAFSEIHPDYYRIPVSDREAMMAEERAAEEAEEHGTEAPADRHGDAGHPTDEVHYDSVEDAAFDAHDHGDHEHGDHGHEHHDHVPGTVEAAPYTPAQPSDDGLSPVAQYAPAETTGDEPATQSSEAAGEAPESGHTQIVDLHDEPVPVETVGGDEFEEAQTRPRVRHYRNYKIQEVIKRRQIILVQVTKEERGNKGAALTTYLSLAGRYCVLMPNAGRGGGVSRKITSAADRRRLKELMDELEVPDGMGIIVRTAGSERSKAEIKRDYEYLLRLWDDIRELTLRSSAPALIYEEGNLIKRAIRDLYSRDMEEILVEGAEGYRTAKEFMRMLMPSHSARVKSYRDPSIPLLHRFQVDSQIDQVHNPVVQLRSGGYIVINPTEALVSIDVNSGRATKERNIEETATKTNLEAAEEIARQLRLRDLAGLVVIDFIDMEEGRNQKAVEGRLKDAMKSDRARIQLGRISAFGLLELSRQRMRSSLIEASTQPCPHCNGTGTIRSTESTALVVLRALEDEGIRRRTAEVVIYVPTQIALYCLNQKRDALIQIEQRYGFRVSVAADDSLIPPAFRLDRLRALTPAELAALPVPAMIEIDEEEEEPEESFDEEVEVAEGEERAEHTGEAERGESDQNRRKRRRRRRRRGEGDEPREADASGAAPAEDASGEEPGEAEADEAGDADEQAPAAEAGETAEESAERKRRRRGKRGGRRRRREEEQGVTAEPLLPGEGPQPEYVEDYPSALDYARDGREHIFAERVEMTPDQAPAETAPAMAAAIEAAETAVPALPETTGESAALVAEAPTVSASSPEAPPAEPVAEAAPKRKRTPRKKAAAAEAVPTETVEAPPAAETAEPTAEAPPKRKRAPRKKTAAAEAAPAPETVEPTESVPVASAPVPDALPAHAEPEPASPAQPKPEPVAAVPAASVETVPSESDRPRKTGWWKRLIS